MKTPRFPEHVKYTWLELSKRVRELSWLLAAWIFLGYICLEKSLKLTLEEIVPLLIWIWLLNLPLEISEGFYL